MNTRYAVTHGQHFQLQRLMAALTHEALPSVWNPYAARDPTLDLPNAADIRLANLTQYLHDHQHARIALIGEAAGYAGCRFTGIPFTCEAQLRECADRRYRTSSRRGDFDERSARCVWHTLFGGRGFSRSSPPAEASASCAYADVILWNIFPWHPHQPGQPLSNRKPTAAEVRAGMQVLELFFDWLRPEHVFAVGRVAEQALREMAIPATYVRHPSHGGASLFKQAMAQLV
jgi:uracil-DNA glycosylase